MNAKDIQKFGFKPGDKVDLYNFHGGKERVARNFIIIEFSIPEGCSATYFPETNCLVPLHHTAERSNTPISKFLIVRFEKYNGEEG